MSYSSSVVHSNSDFHHDYHAHQDELENTRITIDDPEIVQQQQYYDPKQISQPIQQERMYSPPLLSTDQSIQSLTNSSSTPSSHFEISTFSDDEESEPPFPTRSAIVAVSLLIIGIVCLILGIVHFATGVGAYFAFFLLGAILIIPGAFL